MSCVKKFCSQTFDTLATFGVPMGFSPTKAFIVQGVGQDLVLVKHRHIHSTTFKLWWLMRIHSLVLSTWFTVMPVDSSWLVSPCFTFCLMMWRYFSQWYLCMDYRESSRIWHHSTSAWAVFFSDVFLPRLKPIQESNTEISQCRGAGIQITANLPKWQLHLHHIS